MPQTPVVNSTEDFNRHLENSGQVFNTQKDDMCSSDPRLLNRNGLVIFHFWSSRAEECLQINDVLQELSRRNDIPKFSFVNVEAESLVDISKKYGVSSVPTCILVLNKNVVGRTEGADVPLLTQKVKEILSNGPKDSVPTSAGNGSSDLNQRLSQLINKSQVMLFIKGTPGSPRCGFSRQLIDILNHHKISYDSFDILTDEDVRQGLKTYSKWPTYPQIYVKGSLVGGLDIIKELLEMGELESTLNPQ